MYRRKHNYGHDSIYHQNRRTSAELETILSEVRRICRKQVEPIDVFSHVSERDEDLI